MNSEFFDALYLFEKERGISKDYLLEKIKTAIGIAVKKDYGISDNLNIQMDVESKKFKVNIVKTVVEEIVDPTKEILIDEAIKHNKKAIIGSVVEIKLETKQLGRIAAQTAKSIIKQSIRDAERSQLLEQYNSKLHKIVSGIVQKIEPNNGNIVIEVDKSEITLFKNEQIPNERFTEGDRIKVYVCDVIANEKRCNLKVSRAHKDFVRKLFEMEVPEIADGTIKIKSVSREAGSRTKISVFSTNENIDGVGSCIGSKGMRISAIVDEINGEKIDIIKYSEDCAEFIAEALAPASVINVRIVSDSEKTAQVVVPGDQLSLAIGNKGQNAKLAARLTGYKIDIISEVVN